ncbi:hypothetical protein CTAYLR_010559 [Chrysophaeum taylorii]|uniref:C3H1-type domain-containing protein n=1 Tax=Chrysophaeum taylorii TaxID=2483200 RepID=A0AAD7XKF3_9STRA|nr:hypothetical protein CTAYLR_010559 [Chrysophaeum taylorii]
MAAMEEAPAGGEIETKVKKKPVEKKHFAKQLEPRVPCRVQFDGKGKCQWGVRCRFAHEMSEVGLEGVEALMKAREKPMPLMKAREKPMPLMKAREKPMPGYMFLCDKKTRADVLKLGVFGLPNRGKTLAEMEAGIRDTTKLFLWDFKACRLFGPFAPDGPAALNLEKDAFDGRFPAQQRYRVVEPPRACVPPRKWASGPIDEDEVAECLDALKAGNVMAEFHDEGSNNNNNNNNNNNKSGSREKSPVMSPAPREPAPGGVPRLHKPAPAYPACDGASLRHEVVCAPAAAAAQVRREAQEKTALHKRGRRRASVEDLEEVEGAEEEADEAAAPGWIFVCNAKQEQEILSKRIFALREQRLSVLRCRIKDQTSLFVYNCESRMVLGVFKRRGEANLDIVPDAFNGKFRAQVRFYVHGSLLTCSARRDYNGGPLTAAEVETFVHDLHDLPPLDELDEPLV